jgi:hypothetical protein
MSEKEQVRHEFVDQSESLRLRDFPFGGSDTIEEARETPEEQQRIAQEKAKKMATDQLGHAMLTIYEEFAQAGEVKSLSLEEYEAAQKSDREEADRRIAEFEAGIRSSKP